jgi:hypothetical protein
LSVQTVGNNKHYVLNCTLNFSCRNITVLERKICTQISG